MDIVLLVLSFALTSHMYHMSYFVALFLDNLHFNNLN